MKYDGGTSKVYHKGLITSLEPRLMYDGAALVTAAEAVETISEPAPEAPVNPEAIEAEAASEPNETPNTAESVDGAAVVAALSEPVEPVDAQLASNPEDVPAADASAEAVVVDMPADSANEAGVESPDAPEVETVASEGVELSPTDVDLTDVDDLADPADAEKQEGLDADLEATDTEGAPDDVTQLAVVDADVADKETLIAAISPDIAVVELEKEQGLAELNVILNDYEKLDAIHIVSHGQAGEFSLGADTIGNETLEDHRQTLIDLGSHLNEGGDLLLYGCDLAINADGKALVEKIADLTGADVAASDDATGSLIHGGDAELEYQVGPVEAQTLMADVLKAGYQDLLAPFNTVATADELVTQLLTGSGITLVGGSVSYAGTLTAASTFGAINLGMAGGTALALDGGILVTSGDGTPPTSSTQIDYGVANNGNADADLETMASVTNSKDAFVLEFDFTLPGGKNAVQMDFMFGSEEYDEYVDTAFVDAAAIIVDGVNYAKFSNDAPLKVTSDAELVANAGWSIEYDGMCTPKTVVAKVNESLPTHHMKIVIADTSDQNYDSGLFLSFAEDVFTAGDGGIVTNQAPTIDSGDTSGTGDEDNNIVGDLDASDPDAGDTQTWAISSGAGNGSASVDSNGTWTYTPNANWSGSDSFTVQVEDSGGLTDTQVVNVTVNPVNDDPNITGVFSGFIGDEDNPMTQDLDVTDIDSGSHTWSVSGDPVNGSATILSNGTWTYTPDANWSGNDSFTVMVDDGSGGTDTQLIEVTINPADDAPTIDSGDTTGTGDEDNNITGDLDASDPDIGDTQTWSISSGAGNGSASVDSNGTWTYTPNANWFGSDSFTVQVEDSSALTDTQVVNVTVNPVNDDPNITGTFSGFIGDEDNPMTQDVDVFDIDSGSHTWSISGDPANGSATIASNGTWTYTPDANWSGNDSFTVMVDDGSGGTDTQLIELTINPVNDRPDLDNSGAPALSAVTEDTTDPTGTSVAAILGATLTDVDGPGEGIAVTSFSGDGAWQYKKDGDLSWTNMPGVVAANALLLKDTALVRFVPNLANNNAQVATVTYKGWDQFTGTEGNQANTNAGTSFSNAVDTASINVTAVNDAPSITGDSSGVGTEDSSLFGDLDDNDPDTGETLTWEISVDPSDGTAAVDGNGGWTYTPNANWNGSDSFTVKVTDSGALSDTQVVNITINPFNDAPVLDNSSPFSLTTIDEDATDPGGENIGVMLGAAVTDADSSPLTGIAITGSTGSGTWQYNTGGAWNDMGSVSGGSALLLTDTASIRFVPDPVYNMAQTASLDFRAWDQTSGSETNKVNTGVNGGTSAFSTAVGTAELSVSAVNDDPIWSVPGGQTVSEDTDLSFSGANAITVADVDVAESAGELQITLSVDHGSLTLGGVAGLNGLSGNGTGNVSFSGTAADINTALSGMVYHGDADYNASGGPETLTLTVNDQGNTGVGGGTDITETVAINVTATNDDPVWTIPGNQTVDEDNDLVFSTGNGNLISVADADAAESGGELAMTLSVTHGSLTLSTTAGLNGLSGNATNNVSFTGTATAINAALDGLVYRGDLNYNTPEHGAETLTLSVNDQGNSGSGGGADIPASVSIFVTAINDSPVLDDSGEMVLTEVTEDEVDPPGDTVADIVLSAGGDRITDVDFASVEGIAVNAISGFGQWQYNIGPGWVTISGVSDSASLLLSDSASLRFLPDPNYHNPQTPTISFRAWDRTAGAEGTVADTTVNGGITPFSANLATGTPAVTAVNDAPVITGDASGTGDEDGFISGDLEDNDPDFNDTMSWQVLQAPSHGTAVIDGNGTWTYTPGENYNGPDSFVVQVSDGKGGVDTQLIEVNVLPVNDMLEVFGPQSASGDEDTTIRGDFDADDVDGDAISWSIAAPPRHGSVTIDGNGTWLYTPDPDYYGTDAFTIQASDGHGGSVTRTVQLTIRPVDDPLEASEFLALPMESTPPQTFIADIAAGQPVGEAYQTFDFNGEQSDTGQLLLALAQTVNAQGSTPVPLFGGGGEASGNWIDGTSLAYLDGDGGDDFGSFRPPSDADFDMKVISVNREAIRVMADGQLAFVQRTSNQITEGLMIESMRFEDGWMTVKVMDADPARGAATYTATLIGGKPIPTWIQCDPFTGVVQGQPPQGIGELKLRIIATGEDGEAQLLELTIDFGAMQTDAQAQPGGNDGTGAEQVVGAVSLNQQLAAATSMERGYSGHLMTALARCG